MIGAGMSATVTSRNGHSANPVGDGRLRRAEIGGLIEVVEWDEPCDLAWTSVTGIDQRGRWRLRARDGDRTRRDAARLRRGRFRLLGWVAEQVAAPTVRGHLRRSLQQLKRQIEHDELRRQAAVRRSRRRVRGAGPTDSSGGT
jgi:hypothetical protein